MSGPERNAEDPKEPLSFDQLSSVVTQLEDGELPLTTFERGVALSRVGSKRDSAFRRGAGR